MAKLATCPRCKRIVPPDATRCARCGHTGPLNVSPVAEAPAHPERPDPEVVRREDDMLMCVRCGELSPMGSEFCLHCRVLADTAFEEDIIDDRPGLKPPRG